jgi:hypothetical protein
MMKQHQVVARFSATSELNHECCPPIKRFGANCQDQPVAIFFHLVGNIGGTEAWSTGLVGEAYEQGKAFFDAFALIRSCFSQYGFQAADGPLIGERRGLTGHVVSE